MAIFAILRLILSVYSNTKAAYTSSISAVRENRSPRNHQIFLADTNIIFWGLLKANFRNGWGRVYFTNRRFFATKRPEHEMKVRIHRRGNAKKTKKKLQFYEDIKKLISTFARGTWRDSERNTSFWVPRCCSETLSWVSRVISMAINS